MFALSPGPFAAGGGVLACQPERHASMTLPKAPSAAQLLLGMFALHYDPIRPNELKRLWSSASKLCGGWEHTSLEEVLGELTADGQIYYASDGLRCPPELAEDICCAHLSTGTLTRCEQALQLSRLHPGTSSYRSAWDYRQFRLAVFNSDLSRAYTMAEAFGMSWGQVAYDPFERMALHLHRYESYLALHPKVAVKMAMICFDRRLMGLPAPACCERWLRDAPYADNFLVCGLELLQLMREGPGHLEHPDVVACGQALAGSLEDALKNSLLGGLERDGEPPYFLLVAAIQVAVLLAVDKTELALKTARDFVTSHNAGRPLVWLCRVRSGELNKPLEVEESWSGVELLVGLCCLYWGGFPEKATLRIAELAAMAERCRENEFEWLALQAEALQRALEGESPAGVSGLLRPLEPWSRAMGTLLRLANQVQREERLVWLLVESGNRIEVEPKLQKRTKRGSWTAGRLVPVRRLLSSHTQALCEHDRLVCGRVAAHCWERGYEVIKLRFLAGHPRVFWSSDKHTPVEVIVSRPEVRLREEAEGVHLRMNTEFSEGEGETVTRETPHRLRVVVWEESHRELAQALGERGTEFPKAQWAGLATLLPELRQLISLDSDLAFDPSSCLNDGRLWVELAPWGEGLHLEVFVKPLGASGPVFRPGRGGRVVVDEQGQTERDLERERALHTQLHFLLEEGFSAQLPQTLESLRALRDLEMLPDSDFVLAWPKGQSLRLRGSAVGSSSLSLAGRTDRDWLRLSGELKVDEELVLSFQDLLQAASQATGEFIPLGNGQFLQLTEEFRRRIEMLARMATPGKKDVKVSSLAAALTLEDAEIEGDAEWRELVRRLTSSEEYSPPPLPPELEQQLRDYQRRGVEWLSQLAHWRLGGCLADDMGLGKTIQALSVVQSLAQAGPCLVVAPTSVCGNWKEEAERFTPSLTVRELGATGREELLRDLGPGDLLVLSYGLLVREASALQEIDWSVAILDEAQAIKNPRTHRARSAFALSADFRLALSGTPVENRLTELWSIFRFLNPSLLGSLKSFQSRLATPIEKTQDPVAQEVLSAVTGPFLLRRTKGEVLQELPPRTEVTLRVELSDREYAHYESLRRRAVEKLSGQNENAITILAELTRLRQAACHPRLVDKESKLPSSKLVAFEELVHDLREGGHRALVFSQFVEHLKLIQEHLRMLQVPHLYLDGSTPAAQRRTLVNSFQEGEGDLFLISLRAGGTGLNLTGADYVIHLDPWWNPAVEDQASDRAHRIGQTRPVTVYRLLSKNTIEEQIAELHQEKRELADSVLANGAVGGLDPAQLMQLLQLGGQVMASV